MRITLGWTAPSILRLPGRWFRTPLVDGLALFPFSVFTISGVGNGYRWKDADAGVDSEENRSILHFFFLRVA